MTGDAVGAKVDSKSDADRSKDDVGRHNDGEAHEGLVESFLAGGDFARFSAREGVLVTSVDDVAKDEVGGSYGDIGEDIRADDEDAVGEAGFVDFATIGEAGVTVPRDHAKEIATIIRVGLLGECERCDRRD